MKNDVGYLIKLINDKLKTKADADLKKYGLTFSQSRVFVYLEDHGGQATQKEIELFLEVSHPTVVGIISRMEQNGYVTCWTDSSDRRNKNVSLTPKARSIGIDMQKSIEANEIALIKDISEKDAEHLRNLLLTILKNLD